MFDDPLGPIEHFSWAKFVVRGREHSRFKGAGKDILVIGDEVKEWKDMGGHHLTPRSMDCIRGIDLDILVIGDGVSGVVDISGSVIQRAKEHGIREIIVEHTPKACSTYNEIHRKGRKVALLAHGTC